MTYLKKAEEIARKAHAGQTRRGGEPYVNHPERVVNALIGLGVTDEDVLCAARLYDVVEDTDYLIPKESFTYQTHLYIQRLTKGKQDYFDYIRGLKHSKDLTLIKLCDIRDNLSDNPTEKQKKKYLKALYILIN